MKTGIYYYVHSDKLSPMTGYYNINEDQVDGELSKFYSSPELAHDAYVQWKEKRKQISEKNDNEYEEPELN